jgi:hypothetical protein
MKRVVVLGLMGQYPMGGMAWQVLHYLIGFQRLGCTCHYVENSAAPPYSPRLGSIATSARENLAFLRATFRRFDLGDAWSYYDCLTDSWGGMGGSRTRQVLERADLIVNLCGATLPDRAPRPKGCLAYVETDPGIEQVRLANGDAGARSFVQAHDLHFTYGWRIGEPDWPIPACGIDWRKTHPPVVVDLWDSPPRDVATWRTVGTYRNEGKDVVVGGRKFLWSKHPSFDRVMDLPSRTRERLELALWIADRDGEARERLLRHGWLLRDPYAVSHDAEIYRRYLQEAKGEFTVEKDQLVGLRPGWFSDRSVCFLAAGRPCVLQDTGFDSRIPAGPGLLAWSTVSEAAEALERVAGDFDAHSRGAREVAQAFFDTRVLLPPILEAAGL